MPLATEEHPAQQVAGSGAAERKLDEGAKTLEQLARIVVQFAATDGWMERVRLRTDQRWYERLYQGPNHDIWVISWLPGQSTGFHDHGASAGAFVVATGLLEEHRPGEEVLVIAPGEPRTFLPDYTHDVRNGSLAPAISIHAYSPQLTEMNEYALDGDRLIPRERGLGEQRPGATDQERQLESGAAADWRGVTTIDQMLAAARSRLRRVSPEEAFEATRTGAVLVDIRPAGQRGVEGGVPGALLVERNVLEWRFDPASDARLPVATGHDVQVIVFCSEGYTSSLAGAVLQDLGLWRATDVVGGFQAWRAAGLPVVLPADPDGPSSASQEGSG